MSDERKELLEVAAFDTEFEAHIFINLLASSNIEGHIWNLNEVERNDPTGWAKVVRVWNGDWEQARLLYEEKYPEMAEKTILVDGKNYVSIQGKQCKHCMSTDVYIPEPHPLQILLNAVRYVFFLGASHKDYYCGGCERRSRF